MNLEAVERLDLQDGDVVILKVSDVKSQQTEILFKQIRQIKTKLTKNVQFLIFTNDWSKLIEVDITDAKGRLFETDKLIKQLIRVEDALVNKIKIQGTADQLTQKRIQNLEFIKKQRGL